MNTAKRRNVNLDGLAPCHGWRRAAFRRGDREEVSRERMTKLNALTHWPRMRRWALALLSIGKTPAEVTRLTGVKIVDRKEGDTNAEVR